METSQVLISNTEEFTALKQEFRNGGADKIHVLADFDRTFTKAVVDGEPVPSVISILRSEHYLTEDYSDKANALFEQYAPIESDIMVPPEQKRAAMEEWWSRHFDLLIKSGLSRQDIEKAIKSPKLQLREGAKEFISNLKQKKIPLVIVSSAGLGVDSLSLLLDREDVDQNDIFIVSNQYEWDVDGKAVSVRKPIIHSLNKDETTLSEFPFYEEIKERNNVLLLGDSLDDIGMAVGAEYENLLTVGFLNKDIDENLPAFKQAFDMVIAGDGSFEAINRLIKEIS